MRLLIVTLALLLSSLPVKAAESVEVCTAMTSGSGLKDTEQHFKKLISGKEGWVFSSDYLKPIKPLETNTTESLARLQKALSAKGTQLVLALVPLTTMLYPEYLEPAQDDAVSKLAASYTAVLAQVKAAGILAPDLASAMKAGKAEGDVFFARDTHWTPHGAELAAKATAKQMAKSAGYKQLSKGSFSTKVQKTVDYKGQYGDAISRICKTDVPAQKLEVRATSGGANSESLLGDGPAVDVVLTGTSMSAPGHPFFNFSGSLQEALGSDVLNLSVGGGRADTALIGYLNSESFAKAPPKFLIWETPAYYSLNNPSLLRQLIPAVKGSCSQAIAENSSKLAATTSLLTFGGESSAHDYLQIKTDDLALLEFEVTLTYASGDETVTFKRSSRSANSGLFYLELSKPGLRSASLKAAGRTQGQVTTRLCAG